MAARKKTTRKPAGRTRAGKPRPASHRARIRMYRVGLGDCFLLTFYTGPTPRHILIDCGMFKGSRLNPSEKEQHLQSNLVRNIVAETGGKIDVVVITHEHMDHVSIFKFFEDKKIKLGEVWFGWVEDDENKAARQLRKKYEGLQAALQAALSGLQKLDGSDLFYEDLHQGIAGVAEFTGLGADGKKIAQQPRDAMNFVKGMVKDPKKRRYGSPGDIWEFAGVKVYVLGPPTAEKQLRIMERVGSTYDRAFGIDDEETDDNADATPFAQQWQQKASINSN